MILVVGSTGKWAGSEICRVLSARGIPFRAMVRATSDPAKVEYLRSHGAQLVVGDLRDPASLKAACQGVSGVICTVASIPFTYQPGVNDLQTTDIDGITSLIEAAKAAGVKHFVYTSFSGGIDREFPYRNAKRTIEQHLKESGMVYTNLRPTYFMEAWLSPMVGFDAANAKATIYGTGDQPIAWISCKDVAEFAVESLENPVARNRALELGGPEALSPHQVIKLFEEVGGKPFEVTHVPAEALQAQFDGLADPFQKSFTGLMLCYTDGDPIDMSELQKSFNVGLTPVKEYIATVMAPA